MVKSATYYNVDKSAPAPTSSELFFKNVLKAKDKTLFRTSVTERGSLVHENYEQRYKGIKVEDAGYTLHFKDGKIFYAHGNYVNIQNLDVVPKIDKVKARNVFADYQNIPVSKIADYTAELLIKEFPQSSNQKDKKDAKLVYKVFLRTDVPNKGEYGYIDAHSGKVIGTEPSIIHFSKIGQFSTRYNGLKQGVTQYYNGSYHLSDSTRGAVIHTWNLNNNPTGETNLREELSDQDNVWTSQEHTNKTDMGLDVHWTLQQIYDHLFNTYHINSFDNKGYPITAYIKAYMNNGGKDNAAWNRETKTLFFGEGSFIFKPLACIDVIAHEFGHGITHFQIGWSGREQSLNEGMSDIWGAIMEYRLSGDHTNVWKMGEQIMIGYDCLRNLGNVRETHAYTQISDTYETDSYNRGGAYVRSGVFSHWFYLLVNGGTGTNGKGNKYAVIGSGMDVAENLIVEAVFNGYLRNTKSYEDVREAFINAARGMENFRLSEQVQNAWHAVGVGVAGTIMEIDGPSDLYRRGFFSIKNLPENASVEWSCKHPLASITLENNAKYALYHSPMSAGNYDDVITAKVIYQGKEIYRLEKTIRVGLVISDAAGMEYFGVNVVYAHTRLTDYDDIRGLWSVNGGQIIDNPFADDASFAYPGTVSAAVIVPKSGYYDISVAVRYGRYTSESYSFSAYLIGKDNGPGSHPGPGPMLYPNPATGYVNISTESITSSYPLVKRQSVGSKQPRITNDNYQILLWSSTRLIKKIVTDQSHYQLDLTGLPAGLYYVNIIKGGNTYKKKLVVK